MSDLGTTPRSFLSLTKVYNALGKVQNASAIVFSTFTVIHGAQILATNVGGARLANHWIILGRPIYQDEHLEGILVTGSAITHVVAGWGKLAIKLYWNRNNPKEAFKPNPAVSSYHTLSGVLLIPLAGLHYYLVRTLPIKYYGDNSFIDFGYIAWGLQNKPVFTYGLHTALAIAATYHFVSGVKYLCKGKKTIIDTRNDKEKDVHDVEHTKIKKQQILSNGVIAAISVALVSSLIIIGKDTKKIPLRLDFAKMYSHIV